MQGMTINEFYDKLYDALDLEFKVKNSDSIYFIDGFFRDGLYHLTIYDWSKDINEDCLLNKSYKTPEDRYQEFETLKVFNGKTIFEVLDDITVISNG